MILQPVTTCTGPERNKHVLPIAKDQFSEKIPVRGAIAPERSLKCMLVFIFNCTKL